MQRQTIQTRPVGLLLLTAGAAVAVAVAYGDPWRGIPIAIAAAGATLAAYASVKDLVTVLRARRDLSSALARSSAETRVQLRRSFEADDLAGVLALIGAHVGALPAGEQAAARQALGQRSESGRRYYAHAVAAASLRQ